MTSWHNNLKTINGLWPDANWTPEESTFYREQLEHLNQQWLESAVKKVRIEYSARKPALKWLRDEYEKVKDDKTFNERIEKDRINNMSEEGINEIEIQKMRRKLEDLNEEEQIALAERLHIACGMKLDFNDSLENWSNFRIAMASAALS